MIPKKFDRLVLVVVKVDQDRPCDRVRTLYEATDSGIIDRLRELSSARNSGSSGSRYCASVDLKTPKQVFDHETGRISV